MPANTSVWNTKGNHSGSLSCDCKVHRPLCLTPLCALCITIGETASLKNACRQYGVTEEQARRAELPCQYRSCHGNPYAVVKLSDMADLKAKLQKEAKEVAKQKLFDELGEDGYAKKMAALKAAKMKEQADLKAAKEKVLQLPRRRPKRSGGLSLMRLLVISSQLTPPRSTPSITSPM